MEPSPPPKVRAKRWPWVVGLAVAAGATATWVVPGQIHRHARRELVERLADRTGQPVSLGPLALTWEGLTLDAVLLGPPDKPLIALEHVSVTWDPDALWRGQVAVTSIAVAKGKVAGERAELEALAARVRGGSPSTDGDDRPSRSRLELRPTEVTLTDLSLNLTEHRAGTDEPRTLTGVLDVEADFDRGSGQLRLAKAEAQAAGRVFTAQTISLPLRADTRGAVPKPQFPLRLEVEDFGTQVTPKVAVAGVDGWVELSDSQASEIALDLHGGFSDRAEDPSSQPRLWSLTGRLRRDLSGGQLRATAGEFELGRVPQVLAQLPVVESEHATVGGNLSVAFVPGLARVEGDLVVDGLTVHHPVLSRQPVADLGFKLQFAAELERSRMQIDHATLARKGLVLGVRGDFELGPEQQLQRYDVSVSAPAVPCQTVLDGIPAALIPGLQGFALEGEFGLEARVSADHRHLDDMILDGDVELGDCRVRRAPFAASAQRLAQPFVHRVTLRDGSEGLVDLRLGSDTFTPLQLISPYMLAAVLTTEDGGFWHHRGFLTSQFRTAMQRNLAAGKVRLGASTITMQMVKNVLLSHERTLSRKLQELFLTWYLETALSKARIMEIYLNVIEFGPGIYGVTRAARHYFGKLPYELTPPEAAYLALMLPSPVRRHSHYCRGELSPAMQVKLDRILGIMHDRERLSDEEYLAWREVPIFFDLTERVSVGQCLAEIDRLLAATEGQRALSGVLGPQLDDDADASPEEDEP